MVIRLDTAPFDVLLIQETHRGFGGEYNEWQAGEWYLISSPDVKSRFAGVAIAIRRRFARHYGVRSLEVVPGRLLHVRLTGKLYSIDLLSCYQHVISSRDSASVNASRREQYWNKLGSYVAGLPRRNILLLGAGLQLCSQEGAGSCWICCSGSQPISLRPGRLYWICQGKQLMLVEHVV